MAVSQTHFQNAHNFTVNGGQFLSIAQTNIKYATSDNDPVSTTLWQHVAAGAIFDSAERFPPPKCYPGTRERIIEKIVDWINNPIPIQRVLWVYGLAGVGKSALSHTICDRHKDRCGGSFFFARGPTDRGKGIKLFATLSYQLAIRYPAFRAALNEALYHDPSLPTKSMEAQLLSLIIQPILQCQSFQEHSPILIIDGLDECADDQGTDTQRNIITLISQSIVEYNIPLRFLIASRPEFWIRDAFESSPLPSITLSLSLRDDIDADKDIEAYLTEEFEKIRVENKRTMGSVTPPWPPTDIVKRFVYEACGQYIYAATVLKFVGKSSKFSNPQEQLHIIITHGPHRALAYSELDRLYKTILSAYPRWTTMKRVLGGILVGANSTIIEKILGVDPTELTLVLDALSPLIDIEMPGPLSHYEQMLEPIYGSLTTGQDKIRLCHLSFREFLEDESRSAAFHIDICNITEEICRAFLDIICRNIDQNYAIEPHLSLDTGLATYQHMMDFITYELRKTMNVDTFCQLITATTHSLLQLDRGLEMEYPGCFMADMNWLDDMLSNTFSDLDPSRPSTSHELYFAGHEKIGDDVSLARKRCIHLLSTYKRFSVTPTLAYLQDFRRGFLTSLDSVFNIGHTVADVLSALQQHRHIIPINHRDGTWFLTSVRLDISEFDYDDCNDVVNQTVGIEGWRTRGEWRYQRILIMSQRLNIILKDGYDGWDEHLFKCLGRFFNSPNLSDIRSRKHFQNPCNLSILESMSNFPKAYSCFNIRGDDWGDYDEAPRWDLRANFIVPVLCWFNRQLTNTTTLNILEGHDENLVPKMKTAIQHIFEHHFRPNYIPCHLMRSIGIRVLPLPQGYYDVTRGRYHYNLYNLEQLQRDSHWRRFHDEVFGMAAKTGNPPTINNRYWHPYLATRLLQSLALFLYEFPYIDPGIDDGSGHLNERSFAYILECLPYAETTQENLDLLRTIVYFFPKPKLKLDLPVEFWSLSVDFLKKYDRSILSEKELNLFESLMRSLSQKGPGIQREGVSFLLPSSKDFDED